MRAVICPHCGRSVIVTEQQMWDDEAGGLVTSEVMQWHGDPGGEPCEGSSQSADGLTEGTVEVPPAPVDPVAELAAANAKLAQLGAVVDQLVFDALMAEE